MPLEEITYRDGVKKDLKDIKELVTYTNGKVRKIIIALVAVAAFSVGSGLANPNIIALLAKFL